MGARTMQLQRTVLRKLYGGLWHTTHPKHFQQILQRGAILPEPDIPESERWKTIKGVEYHPFARILGAVSLFDFDNFDPESYSKNFALSDWHVFVPFRSDWGCAVWIEIDRGRVGPNFISASNLIARWNEEKAYRHAILPHLEAAHIGALSRETFVRTFAVREDSPTCEQISLT